MNNFRKLSVNAIFFAIIYTFCMYHNRASITFPILMAAGIALLYSLSKCRKPFDNKLSIFYNSVIMLVSVSVFMTDDDKLIFMSKCIVLVLYLCLATELFFNDSEWQDIHYIKNILSLMRKTIGMGFHYFGDRANFREEQKQNNKEENKVNENVMKVVKGFMIAVPLLFIIIPLMMSADVVFMNMMEKVFDIDKIFDELFFGEFNVISFIFHLVIAFILFYGFIKTLTCSNDDLDVSHTKKPDTVTAITVTGIVGFIYGLFSFVQIRGILFSNVKLPEGYTYAKYAREGFFQLFILALINMGIVLFCAARYEYNKLLKIILYFLCAFTYIMIFASTYKMILYIEVYNLTFLRIMVLWALLVIAVIMAAVIRYIYSDNFSLFKFSVIVVSSFYLIIAFAKPDFITAQYNLNLGNQKNIDWYYLKNLSCDAMPVISGYEISLDMKDSFDMEQKQEYKNIENYKNRAKYRYQDMTLRTFNLSQFIASELGK